MTIKTYCPEGQQGLTVRELMNSLQLALNEGRGDQVVAVWDDAECDWRGVESVGVPDERDAAGLDDALAVTSLWPMEYIAWNGPGV